MGNVKMPLGGQLFIKSARHFSRIEFPRAVIAVADNNAQDKEDGEENEKEWFFHAFYCNMHS